MTTEEKILALFEQSNEWTPKEITFRVEASKQMVHRVLNKLLDEKKLEKLGRPPKVIYRRVQVLKEKYEDISISEEEKSFLEKEFLLITETGEYLEGVPGFLLWCRKRNLPFQKTVKEFIKTKSKYLSYYDNNGFIEGTEKLKNTKGYPTIYLDRLFYLDFYPIERFGKTKLGTLLHYAKQGQNKFLMRKMMDIIQKKIHLFLATSKAEAIGFVPPTIRREVQLMDFIKSSLTLEIVELDIKKISGIIPVPQKSLNRLEDRINNADRTFAIFGNSRFETVLLLDDAVGSGATLNQISKKIKDKGIAKRVIGLAVVGSFKGFDVITDV